MLCVLIGWPTLYYLLNVPRIRNSKIENQYPKALFDTFLLKEFT